MPNWNSVSQGFSSWMTATLWTLVLRLRVDLWLLSLFFRLVWWFLQLCVCFWNWKCLSVSCILEKRVKHFLKKKKNIHINPLWEQKLGNFVFVLFFFPSSFFVFLFSAHQNLFYHCYCKLDLNLLDLINFISHIDNYVPWTAKSPICVSWADRTADRNKNK